MSPTVELVMALAAALALGGEALAAETASLRFGWPTGIEAEVSFEGSRVREGTGQTRTIRARGGYTLTTHASPEGLLVRYRDVRLEPVGIPASASPEQVELQTLMMRAAAALPPEHLVGSDGRIIRFNGTDRMLDTVRAAFAGIAQKMPPVARAGVERALAQVLNVQVIESRLRQDWDRDVGTWAGADLELGEVYELESAAPAPLLGNTMVPLKLRFEYLGRAACHDEDAENRCVKLRMRSTVDSAKVGAALAEFLGRLAQSGQQGIDVKSLRIDHTVRLLSEPSSLLPHRVIVERDTAMTVVAGGKETAASEEQRRLIEYRYR